jgi:hypothetical protein
MEINIGAVAILVRGERDVRHSTWEIKMDAYCDVKHQRYME